MTEADVWTASALTHFSEQEVDGHFRLWETESARCYIAENESAVHHDCVCSLQAARKNNCHSIVVQIQVCKQKGKSVKSFYSGTFSLRAADFGSPHGMVWRQPQSPPSLSSSQCCSAAAPDVAACPQTSPKRCCHGGHGMSQDTKALLPFLFHVQTLIGTTLTLQSELLPNYMC